MNFEATSQLLQEIYPKTKNVLGVFKLRLEKAKHYKSLKPEDIKQREEELATLNWFFTTAAEAIQLAHETRQAEFTRGLLKGKQTSQNHRPRYIGTNQKEAARAAHNNQVKINLPNLF